MEAGAEEESGEEDLAHPQHQQLPPFFIEATGAAAAAGMAHLGCAIKYLPQVGYLLRVPGPDPIPQLLLTQVPGMEFAFEGEDKELGRCFFYHTTRSRELDEELGDIFNRILDMESVLLRDLTARLLEHHSDMLLGAAAVAARLDCLLSLALSAADFQLCRPQLTKHNVLAITGGRHLLQELAVDMFVPNDTIIKDKAGRILIITGPNFSGKSVYVKQVALIVFLAHIGSFVPAESAVVGLTDRIFTRIMSKESSSHTRGALTSGSGSTSVGACAWRGENDSTFSLDVKQMVAMIRTATPRSLCIVDEFGKGTLTSDGIGLLCSVVSHMAQRLVPPKMLICTHFSQVANPGLLQPSPQVVFYTMSILNPPVLKEGPALEQQQQQLWQKQQPLISLGRGEDEVGVVQQDSRREDSETEGITFLYRLTLGRTLESFGFHCAALAGVPADVIRRARQVERCMRLGLPMERLSSLAIGARDAQYEAIAKELRGFKPGGEGAWNFIQRLFPQREGNPSARPNRPTAMSVGAGQEQGYAEHGIKHGEERNSEDASSQRGRERRGHVQESAWKAQGSATSAEAEQHRGMGMQRSEE